MPTPTEEIAVECPRCGHGFDIEVDALPDDKGSAKPSPNPHDGARYYKLAEVCHRLSVSRETVKRWIYRGKLKAVKFETGHGTAPKGGAPWRVAESELKRFIAARR